jgi:hypothetical protein
VLRLSHRVLHTIRRQVGRQVVMLLVRLVALLAQGPRVTDDANSRASRGPMPASERRVDKAQTVSRLPAA